MPSRFPVLSVTSVVLAVAIQSLVARDEEELAKPPKIDAAYVAPAYRRSFFLDVQAMQPRWLYEKQIEKWFPIESCVFEIAHVTTAPVAVPAGMKKQMAEIFAVGTKGAKEEIEKGPLLGPDRAYVVFDSERNPQLIVFRQLGFLVARRAHDVSEGEMFQGYGGWMTVTRDKDILEFLKSVDGLGEKLKSSDQLEVPQPETSFLQWQAEQRKRTTSKTSK